MSTSFILLVPSKRLICVFKMCLKLALFQGSLRGFEFNCLVNIESKKEGTGKDQESMLKQVTVSQARLHIITTCILLITCHFPGKTIVSWVKVPNFQNPKL